MKNKFTLFLMSLLLSFAAVSCSGTEDPNGNNGGDDDKPEETKLSVRPSSDIAFEAEGGEFILAVTCNTDWEVESSESWCKAVKSSETSITVSAKAVAEGAEDPTPAVISVTADDKEVKINATQQSKFVPTEGAKYADWVGTWEVTSSESLVLNMDNGQYTEAGPFTTTVYIEAAEADAESGIEAESAYWIWGWDCSYYRYMVPLIGYFDNETGSIVMTDYNQMYQFETGEILAFYASGNIDGIEGAVDELLVFDPEQRYIALQGQIDAKATNAMMLCATGVLTDDKNVEHDYTVNTISMYVEKEGQLYYTGTDESLGFPENEIPTLVGPFVMKKTSSDVVLPEPPQGSAPAIASSKTFKSNAVSSYLKVSNFIK